MMFKNLPGFRDFYPEDCAIRNAIFDNWRAVACRYAFAEYDAPILEPLDLLTAKSGDEIVAQLFSFEDKGGRALTLRPELTPSLARMVGARAGGLKRPIKWFSIGENFRYERPQKGRLRSFYQMNADILGESGTSADAEVIGLLVDTLGAFGLGEAEFCVRLSDRDLWLLLLEGRQIVGEQALAVLNILDKFERESPDKIRVKLEGLALSDAAQLMETMANMKALDSFAAIQSFLQQQAFASQVQEKIEQRLQTFKALLDRLAMMGIAPFIRLDLSIVRGLAYYTGFVFEAFQLVGKGRALAGGGRYDHLVKKLGGPDLPAVGFGIGDVTLRDLLETQNKLPTISPALDVFVVAAEGPEQAMALRDVCTLRRAGLRVDYAMKGGNFGKQFKTADQSGARYALVYGREEVEQGRVKLKDLQKREETTILLSDLVATLAKTMGR